MRPGKHIMEMHQIDPRQPDEVRRWHDAARAMAEDELRAVASCDREIAGELTHPWPGSINEHWVAVRDGRVVGTLSVEVPQLDNLANTFVEMAVRPDARRLGIGSAIVAHARDRARAHGRTWLIAESARTVPTGATGCSAHEFAHAVGAELSVVEVQSRLDFGDAGDPAGDGDSVDGYHVRSWSGPVPEDLVAEIAELDSRFMNEVPLGGFVREAKNVDEAIVRAKERAESARGRTVYHTVAIHDSTRTVAGWTRLRVKHCPRSTAEQEITLVRRAHRGHGLGLLIKRRNLARLRALQPNIRAVDTWSAEGNHHMIALNEILGFRPVSLNDNWQLAAQAGP
jgi:GNAT superfamily N-acetyltransferase